MKTKYEDINFSAKTIERLELIEGVINHYEARGYKLTLRQLYYQLVAKHIIPNRKQEYKKLSNMLKNARMMGRVDWDSIEDRGRVPIMHSQHVTLKAALEQLAKVFRLQDREDEQPIYLELLTEKEALSSILRPLTMKYHKRLVINKGYTSASAMHQMSKRLKQELSMGSGRKLVLLYLGDHDPSGLDMDRDIKERLETFGVKPEVIRIGLTMKQIKHYNPPPDPAKITDPRAEAYIAKYGDNSWEVDALEPDVLKELVESSILKYMDMDKYNAVKEEENRLKGKLSEFAENCDKKECPDCEGSGQIECKGCEGSGETKTGKDHKACDGAGYKECSTCDGYGEIED